MQRRSSRREETKIAQGGTLGMCSPDRFPPRRGGARLFIVAGFSAPIGTAPTGRILLPLALTQTALRLFWAIFDGSLRERTDDLTMG